MLHEVLSSYLASVSKVISGLQAAHVEVYEEEILTDDDINDNWEVYKDRFLRGVFP